MSDAPREDAAAGRPARSPKDAPSDIAAIVDDSGEHPALDPRRAYEVLEIRTPLEEFDGYVRARIDTLSRLGETEKAQLATEALELGRKALARVTGTAPTIPSEQAR